jgi:hypothetical protein
LIPLRCGAAYNRANYEPDFRLHQLQPRFAGARRASAGFRAEESLLDDEVYDAKGNARIVPILFDDESEDGIPRFLRGWTRCRVNDSVPDDPGFEQLLRIMTGQAKVVKQPLGPVPSLPSRTAGAPVRTRKR